MQVDAQRQIENNILILYDSLTSYYSIYFPFELFEQWFNFGEEPIQNARRDKLTRFSRREIAFTTMEGHYLRWYSFNSYKEFQEKVLKVVPLKIEVGAIYNNKPSDHDFLQNKLRVVETEFRIDIDLSDYDDVRTCCLGTAICHMCWKMIYIASKILDETLRNDFGFEHLLWVYSGRRGIHCWIFDKSALELDYEERKAIIKYLKDNETMKFQYGAKQFPLILKRSLEAIESVFEEIIVQDQKIFQKKPSLIFNIINDTGLIQSIKERIEKSDPQEGLWNIIKAEIRQFETKSSKTFIVEEILLSLLYPRLDTNVSLTVNHLLKAPYCIHPTTRNICIPLKLANIKEFDPRNAPNLEKLLMSTSHIESVCLEGIDSLIEYKRSLQFFEEFFENMRKRTKVTKKDDELW